MPDPATLAMILQVAGQVLPHLMGGQQENLSGFSPSDMFSRQRTTLPGITGTERELAELQANLYRSLMGELGGGLPPELGLTQLAAGELPEASRKRIDEAAFGGLQEAGRRVSRQSQERALAAGVPLSSYQFATEGEMMRGLASDAGQLRAQLQFAELGRLRDLRQRALANAMALRQSPELQGLRQMRLAQATTENLQLGRFPGGLPTSAYGVQGAGALEQAGTEGSGGFDLGGLLQGNMTLNPIGFFKKLF